MMDETRTALWSILTEAFQTILHTLQATMPEVRMMAGYSHNDWFPFRAYAQYSKDNRVVVLSFNVHVKESQMHAFGDIGLEDGTVIKDLMHNVVGTESCDEQVLVTHVKDFALQCQQHASLIGGELDRAGGTNDN